MTEKPEGNSAEQQGVNKEIKPADGAIAEASAPQASNAESGAHTAHNDAGNRRREALRFLGRLTVSEWLTLLVGIGSLVVSFLTYRTAADTSQLAEAVSNLHTMAGSARTQAGAAQGQLVEMRAEQRAWIALTKVEILTPLTFNLEKREARISLKYHVLNVGHLPAFDFRDNIEPFVLNANTSEWHWLDQQKPICDSERKDFTKVAGGNYIVVPNEDFVFDRNYKLDLSNKISFTVIFVGCLTYGSGIDSPPRQSGVVFVLSAPGEENPQTHSHPPIPVKVEILPKDLQIGHLYTAGRAD